MSLITILLIIFFSCLTIYALVLSVKIIKYVKNDSKNFNIINEKYQNELRFLENKIDNNRKELVGVQARIEDNIKHETKLVITECNRIREVENEKIRNEIENLRATQIATLEEEHQRVLEEMLLEQRDLNELIAPLRNELLDYKTKRAAINESIARERELSMQKDFYRIALEDWMKDDIKYLLSIESQLRNKEILRKLIWSEYLQRPLNELVKRVIATSDSVSGIYKITNEDGKMYIGKSTCLKKRWTEHIKSSIEIGGIASQLIHKALKSEWDNFTFEIIEKCDKADLSVRESYWINFYESNLHGYNMRG